MTVTELMESMKAIVDGYDSSFAKRMEELPKEAKTERKALHIQLGASSLVCRAGLLAYTADPENTVIHERRIELCLPHDSKDYTVYSALEEDDRRLASVYLDTINYMVYGFLQRYENELAMAKDERNDDTVFKLTLQINTIKAVLDDLRAWWAEHGCAEFEV
ncbi:MAG: hypothetical protein E7583_11675 [Ruminococcaceae bacterium]|nr:hypothetical protein [Oscillospiraceae bacterium]MBE6708141.1 hypothetical protein [Oscillospiraceae bacterium]